MSCLTNHQTKRKPCKSTFPCPWGLEDILFYAISTVELPTSSFSCFSDSSFWSSEAESFHKPHLYKLLVYYVVWKDNTLSDRDMVFEFYEWEVLELKSCVQVGVHGALETGTNMLLIKNRFKQTKNKKEVIWLFYWCFNKACGVTRCQTFYWQIGLAKVMSGPNWLHYVMTLDKLPWSRFKTFRQKFTG